MTGLRGYTLFLIALLKGGVRKSTTAMMLAFALARRGKKVLLVDADAGTQGVMDWCGGIWADGGALPFAVVQWSPSQGPLIPFIQEWQVKAGADAVIVDVGGEHPEVLKQAARLADLVISPVGAEAAETTRLGPTKAVIGDVQQRVMLTRVPDPKRGIARKARIELEKQHYQVLRTETKRDLDLYSHIYGTIPDDLGEYDNLAEELEKVLAEIGETA